MSYSQFFHPLHDEKEPHGNLGRGTHYSVFEAPQWFDLQRKLVPGGRAKVQRFGVIWDEDHDERIISLAEKAYMLGIFAPVLFIGERKASLNVVVSDDFYDYIERVDGASYHITWKDLASDVFGDYWNFEGIVPLRRAGSAGIIASENQAVATYLSNIQNLWGLGLHHYQSPLDR